MIFSKNSPVLSRWHGACKAEVADYHSLGAVEGMAKALQRASLHPGEILREEFTPGFGLSINRLARDLRVAPTRIGEIVNERRAITPDTALRLARYCGTSAEFWMNLQTAYDLDVARVSLSQIEADVHPIAAA